MWHWLRRHLTTDGQVLGSRLRLAEDARIRAEIACAAKAALERREDLERRLFLLVKKGA